MPAAALIVVAGTGPAVGDLPHLTRPRAGGQIQVTVAPAKENIPDRPADQGELAALSGEPACQTRHGQAGPHSKAGGGTALARGQSRGIRHGHEGKG